MKTVTSISIKQAEIMIMFLEITIFLKQRHWPSGVFPEIFFSSIFFFHALPETPFRQAILVWFISAVTSDGKLLPSQPFLSWLLHSCQFVELFSSAKIYSSTLLIPVHSIILSFGISSFNYTDIFILM